MFRIKSGLKKAIKKFQIASVLTITMLGLSTMVLQPKVSAAVNFGGTFDCTANSIMWCGAKDTSVIQNNYTHGDGHNTAASIQTVYNQFGITKADVDSLGTTAVAGTVTKSGDVYVGSQLVATNALTAGRENISGSTKVTVNGVTFYERKPSVSFVSNSLTAYVVMQNGQFKFASLSACGNPVKATPKPPVTGELACTALLTTPSTVESNGDQTVAFTATASATNASISKYVFTLGSGHGTDTITTSATSATSTRQTYAPGSYNISVAVSGVAKNTSTTAPKTVTCATKLTVNKPNQTCTAPNGQTYPFGSQNCDTCQYDSSLAVTDSTCVPPTTPTTPITTTAAVMPNTGAGNVIGLFLGASIVGAIGYRLYIKRRLARS